MVTQIWQKIDGSCHYCHSWRESNARMITAMTETIILAILTLAFVALGYYTARVIKGDGYADSRRQPPRSHHRDVFDPAKGPTRLA